MRERQGKKIDELKKEVNAVRLKGSHLNLLHAWAQLNVPSPQFTSCMGSTKCSFKGLEMTEQLQHNHSMDIQALKEEMAKVKRAGEDRKNAFSLFEKP